MHYDTTGGDGGFCVQHVRLVRGSLVRVFATISSSPSCRVKSILLTGTENSQTFNPLEGTTNLTLILHRQHQAPVLPALVHVACAVVVAPAAFQRPVVHVCPLCMYTKPVLTSVPWPRGGGVWPHFPCVTLSLCVDSLSGSGRAPPSLKIGMIHTNENWPMDQA